MGPLVPPKPYISYETLSWISERKRARAAIKDCHAQIGLHRLGCAFQHLGSFGFFRGSADYRRTPNAHLSTNGIVPLCIARTRWFVYFRICAWYSRKHAPVERDAFVASKCMEAAAAFESHDCRNVYKCSESIFVRRSLGPCAVLQSDGAIATDPSSVSRAFMDHFNKLLSGSIMDKGSAKQLFKKSNGLATPLNEWNDIVPVFDDFCRLINGMKNGRSPGPDHIPSGGLHVLSTCYTLCSPHSPGLPLERRLPICLVWCSSPGNSKNGPGCIWPTRLAKNTNVSFAPRSLALLILMFLIHSGGLCQEGCRFLFAFPSQPFEHCQTCWPIIGCLVH